MSAPSEGAPGREDVSFPSGEGSCAAWLYWPEGGPEAGPHPIVILAHGFAGTREARLWAYAERFREAGMATLVFDYRHFGASPGEPRQLLSIRRQHQDWCAAIAFARGLEGVDPGRVALWGTSFSGGHVVATAAEDSRIAAVVSQTPFADGLSALRAAGLANNLRLSAAGLRDAARAVTGREPYTIPAVGRPGETAAMNQPDSFDGYRALYEGGDELRNEFCGRLALEIGLYRPVAKAGAVLCPLLVVVLSGDRVTPPEPARRMAERAPHGRLIEYGPEWGGHFEIYVGKLFEKTIVEQVAFLRESLGLEETAAAAAAASASAEAGAKA
jgi:uncharacterized protein